MYTKLIDQRPYKKTVIINNGIAVICRMNVSTKKMHVVKLDADIWMAFYKSDHDTTILKPAKLTPEQVLFISKNVIKDERKQKIK